MADNSLPAAKKRKRGGVAEEANMGKRGDLADTNGAGLDAENGMTESANFAENPQGNGGFTTQSQESHDANAAMAAALQAHGQQLGTYPGGIQQTGFDTGSPTQQAAGQYIDAQYGHLQAGQVGSPTGPGGLKPAVGTEEWHKVRRDNHKEVERRRRETINEGINELAKIVPGSEKNKGSILARTVSYIRELQSNTVQDQDQRSLERQLLEQAVAELSRNNDSLKQQTTDLVAERDQFRAAASRLLTKVKDLGGNVADDEDAALIAKVEQGLH